MKTKTPDQIDIEVGQRIRLQRKVRNISQAALGSALGITFQQVQKYEEGTNRVGASRLSEIAQFLGVQVSFFFSETHPAAQRRTENGGTSAIDELAFFLTTPEGQNLNNAFISITSAAVRKKIVGLVKVLASDSSANIVARHE